MPVIFYKHMEQLKELVIMINRKKKPKKKGSRVRQVTEHIGRTTGLKIYRAWTHFFEENEKRSILFEETEEDKYKPWTDEQIIDIMDKEFPDKKRNSSITRVTSIRSLYNKGTNFFASCGPAKVKSYGYDQDGLRYLRGPFKPDSKIDFKRRRKIMQKNRNKRLAKGQDESV